MKYSITAIVVAAAVAGTIAPAAVAATHKRASAPVVITPPAVPDGSNASRAPFPASRPQNDVTPPNGEAFDQNMPPNTPSTTPEPVAPPPPTVAILQGRTAPGLMPTGRPTVGAAASLDAAGMQTVIRATSYEARDDFIDGIRTRVRNSQNALREFRRAEMSTAGRSQFDALTDEAHARQKALERSLRAAQKANAATWDSARAQLAADYEAYSAAVARVDAAAGIR